MSSSKDEIKQFSQAMCPQDKLYVFLCVLFCIFVLLCNITYPKFVYFPILPFHTFTLPAASILYPLMFMLSDLLAEFYGKKRAQFCVTIAMSMVVIVACIITGINFLQATPWSTVDNVTFSKVFGEYAFCSMVIILTCYFSQMVDIWIYLWVKKITNNKFLWLRNNVSTAISLFVDTVLAIFFLTLFGIFPTDEWQILLINMYSYKIFATVCNTPIFYLAVGLIKKFIFNKKNNQHLQKLDSTQRA